DLAVDFGWFYFLTKPIFYALEYFNRQLGNFGVAILLLTVLIKIAFFPLANKSYRAMSRLKKLQPEMMKIRDRFKEDRQRQNQEMMALYKKENANPVSGCFPILIQIPVFFALYKVLFVAIEMRHAPFFGWIQDLSAPDPLGILTVFGLVEWSIPEMLQLANIGIWPLIMGGTMYLQQKLNPQPADPTQAKIFLMLPIVFTFMLGQFPAGLVIYWAWNNLLSIAQQWIIMRQMGVTMSGQTVALPGGKTKPDSGASSGAKPAAGPAKAKRRKKASPEEAPQTPPKRRPGNNKRKRPRRKAS
ncbi:MAG: membrane protein insertase YidC, partial [Defluviicoccus sp.]|nr:membrane protein insertase YidC [Defluviicoccus sp.]